LPGGSGPARYKPISDARLGQYAAGLFWPGFNLLAEMPDVHTESLDVSPASVPGSRQKMSVREHLSLVQHQFVEQAVFAWRQFWVNAAHPHHPPRKIDTQVAIVVNGRTALHLDTVAQGGANASHEFGYAKRLRDEVIGSCVERSDLSWLVVESGEDDHGRGACGAQGGDQVGAVAIGQTKIQHGKIEPLSGRKAQCARDVSRLFHIEAFGN
jgi:hypothetical protein